MDSIDDAITVQLEDIAADLGVDISSHDTWRTIMSRVVQQAKDIGRKEASEKIVADIDGTITSVFDSIKNEKFADAQNKLQNLLARLNS